MGDTVKIALVGAGNMGCNHAESIETSTEVDLVAVCDKGSGRATEVGQRYQVPSYQDVESMLANVESDAVLIATPHPHHLEATRLAFGDGRHVLVEKPLSDTLSDAQKMIAAHRNAEMVHGRLVFSAMFQQRTYGYWKRIKELIVGKSLGRLMRATWIITDWYRTQAYYDSGGWRATWQHEGGGVLMNQAPHNLDMYQWLVGTPRRITAVAALGKYHQIEVEDEVSIILEHDNGMIGHIISSTAESPGTNRLEIVGEYGTVVFDNETLRHSSTEVSMLDLITTSKERFTSIESLSKELEYEHHGELGHRFVIDDFAKAIRDPDHTPIAPAEEGLASLAIANASILSAIRKRPVELPLDVSEYDRLLAELRGGGGADQSGENIGV